MVTAITLLPGGVPIYKLSLADDESEHYAIEITAEKDIMKATED